VNRDVHARAPGKIIISGEHAVVYGAPALLTAVNRYVDTRIAPAAGITFDMAGFEQRRVVTTATKLEELYTEVVQRYDRFSTGDLPVREVLERPSDLIPLAFAVMCREVGIAPPDVHLTYDIDVPIGCGMGASAAAVVSVLAATAGFVSANIATADLFRLALACEQFQHGNSSGADPYACVHGGCVRFRQGEAESISSVPFSSFYVVDSGRPDATTGECVESVRSSFESSALADEFAAVSASIEAAIEANDTDALYSAVRNNDALLRQIGVVPQPVAAFIDAVAATGGAAKISGAGSVRGIAGGLVIVFAESAPAALCEQFGYRMLDVQGVADGVIVNTQ
jgi:mevalonate kinase